MSSVSASIVMDFFKLSNSFSTSLNSAGAPDLPDVNAVPIFHAREDRSMISPMDGMPAMMVVQRCDTGRKLSSPGGGSENESRLGGSQSFEPSVVIRKLEAEE